MATIMAMVRVRGAGLITESALRGVSSQALTLMNWFSPAFPVGAFAYSHGLEWAHEAGDVSDRVTLTGWLTDLIAHGAARNDAIVLAESWRAAVAHDQPRLHAVAELAMALAASAERRLETSTQGNAFLTAVRAAYPHDQIEAVSSGWRGDIAYPVAVGVASAAQALPLDLVLPAFVNSFAGNLVSAAVRLGVVGQTDGQRIIADLTPLISLTADEAASATLDDLGGCALRSDLASLRHETQYSRLFRS